jgi:hypothetical protein
MGQVQTASTCSVTVTLAQANPAALKVYDVPKASGKLDGVSNATGSYTCCNLPFPAVSTGPITTTHAGDLLLGNLLMVNQLFTPQVFWTDWMSNVGLTCPLNSKCPVDDGADYLPGHGIFSSNSESGHQRLTKIGTYSIERHGHNTGDFNYGGSAIAVQIK